MYFVLFLLGVALGSFLNVLITRYNPDQKFSLSAITGRSYCDSCKKQLRWYELVPLISFIIQKRACRSCGTRLSWQYPFVEFMMGILAVLIGRLFLYGYVFSAAVTTGELYISIIFWLVVSLVLLFALMIDAKHYIIPNGTNILLFILGVIWTVWVVWLGFGREISQGSFLGHFAPLFGSFGGVVLNHIIGMLLAAVFFILIVLVSRGRGMGIGDVKLVSALGLLFGWPDIGVIVFASFIIGTILIIPLLITRQKRGSDQIPFGPFMVVASLVVLVWGTSLLQAYFDIIGKLGGGI
ncbi:MAG: prepilin peptidase [Patescibacteria group bacterium]|nr:prepilin peptidase [Patescibacteria group bacterium]